MLFQCNYVHSCIVFEIKRDVGRKSQFFHTLFHITNSLPLHAKTVMDSFALFFLATESALWPAVSVCVVEIHVDSAKSVPFRHSSSVSQTDGQTEQQSQ